MFNIPCLQLEPGFYFNVGCTFGICYRTGGFNNCFLSQVNSMSHDFMLSLSSLDWIPNMYKMQLIIWYLHAALYLTIRMTFNNNSQEWMHAPHADGMTDPSAYASVDQFYHSPGMVQTCTETTSKRLLHKILNRYLTDSAHRKWIACFS